LGAKNMGEKRTIKWLGIHVTGSHRILVGNLWKRVTDLGEKCSQDALRSGRNLVSLKLQLRVILKCLREKKIAITEGQQKLYCTGVCQYLSGIFGLGIALSGRFVKRLTTIERWVGHGKRSPNGTTRHTEVYDIINCGPRNRFTVLTQFGPVIAHNCVQSIARDIMAEALLRLERAGFPTVLSVHDESISEVEIKENRSIDEYIRLMKIVPTWARGLPVGAEAWRGKRYRK